MADSILDPLPPPRPNIPDPPRVHPNPTSWQQLAENYATTMAFVSQLLPQHLTSIRTELDELRGGINHIGRLVFDVRERMPYHKPVGANVETILPPMRDRSKTYDEIGNHVIVKIKEELDKRASASPGPLVEDTPEALTAVIRQVLDEELNARTEQDRQARDTAELAERRRRDALAAKEEIDRRAQRRAQIVKWVGGVAATLAVSFLSWLGHQAQLRAEHALGFAEGRRDAPAIIVPVPSAAVATIAASAAVSATAPAAAARRP
jgi:hypothetical protein